MIWNESIECMDRESLRKIQSIRLKKIVDYVYHNTPFYRKKMQEMGITPDDINSIDDIVKLPFTTKHDLRDNYPFGLCAVPMSQIVRIHASSGTTGKPTVVGYTRKDLSTWAECISRAFTAYGAGRSDIFRYLMGTDCSRADWEHMQEPKISVLLLFRCPVVTRKTDNLDA